MVKPLVPHTDAPPALSLIVAMAKNRVIGINNRLPWRLRADLQHFKTTTMGKPLLMGRKTNESIGRPLPGRRNIVLTRNRDLDIPGVDCVTTLEQALTLAAQDGAHEIMVMGGAQIYRQLLAHATRIYLTRVDAEPEGDAWFPELNDADWDESDRRQNPADEENDHAFEFVTLERKVSESNP